MGGRRVSAAHGSAGTDVPAEIAHADVLVGAMSTLVAHLAALRHIPAHDESPSASG